MKRLLITLALIITTTLAILTYRDSQIPRATAAVQVHPSMLPLNSKGLTRSYMENEFQTIFSKETKTLAATILGIEEAHHAEAIKLMDENVTSAPIRGSDFISITAKYPDPQQAINIANAIAEAYAQRRAESESKRAQRALQALDEELLSQQEKIANHKKALETYIAENYLDRQQNTLESPPKTKKHSHAALAETYHQAKAMLHEMKIKQREARILLKQPRQPVTIHKRAK